MAHNIYVHMHLFGLVVIIKSHMSHDLLDKYKGINVRLGMESCSRDSSRLCSPSSNSPSPFGHRLPLPSPSVGAFVRKLVFLPSESSSLLSLSVLCSAALASQVHPKD
ncbi:hypothetical protein K1719_002702 [Acacia pycnantha]|nr:hypothetical protein K1719_002702 [Acacia pycnantha]